MPARQTSQLSAVAWLSLCRLPTHPSPAKKIKLFSNPGNNCIICTNIGVPQHVPSSINYFGTTFSGFRHYGGCKYRHHVLRIGWSSLWVFFTPLLFVLLAYPSTILYYIILTLMPSHSMFPFSFESSTFSDSSSFSTFNPFVPFPLYGQSLKLQLEWINCVLRRRHHAEDSPSCMYLFKPLSA